MNNKEKENVLSKIEQVKKDFNKNTIKENLIPKIHKEPLVEGCMCESSKPSSGRYQYQGAVFWYNFVLCQSARQRLIGSEYENVTIIHIMPYRIKKSDFENKSIPNNKANIFKDKILEDPSFMDYDENTGNFHKLVSFEDMEYQIVLAEGGGPNWNDEGAPAGTLGAIKNSWYFPRVYEDETLILSSEKEIIDAGNDPYELLKCALKQLGLLEGTYGNK